jgi:hypothetical protein
VTKFVVQIHTDCTWYIVMLSKTVLRDSVAADSGHLNLNVCLSHKDLNLETPVYSLICGQYARRWFSG